MDKKIEEMDESMQAMQRRLDEVRSDDNAANGTNIGGNAAMQAKDQDGMNAAAMAGAAGGTAGLGTDKNSGGESGAPTGEGFNGYVGGAGTENL